MLKKTSFYLGTLIFGIILLGLGLVFRNYELKPVSGVCFGIGMGLIGMSISNIIMKRHEQKNPDVMKQNEIEFNDERNAMIRNKAKAKSGDIIQWFIMGIVYLMIIIDAPLWVSLVTVCVFALYHILAFYFMDKYQKEL